MITQHNILDYNIYMNLIKTLVSRFSHHKSLGLVRVSNLQGKYSGIAQIELNQPKKKNALSIALLDQLDCSLKQLTKNNSIRACIIRSSEPGHFCSGADLKERLDKSSEEIELIVANLRRIFNDVYNLPFPTFSLLDGIALGGGLELALNTDIRVATKSCLIGLTETYWSLLPGGGGTQTLQRIIGVAKAKELIYTARKINGQEAEKLGIVNYAEDSVQGAEKRIFSMIDEMLPNGPIGIKYAKKAINWGGSVDLRTGLEIERMNYEKVVISEDRKEGFRAFAEKRTPTYKNK